MPEARKNIMPFTHILHALDLSDDMHRTLCKSIALANALESHLTLIHVIKETKPTTELMIQAVLGYGSKDEMKQKSREKIMGELKNLLRKMCDEYSSKLPACRFSLSGIIVEFGQPVNNILRQAESGAYDLLVVGRHDYGLVDEILLGHSTRGLLRYCPIPVLQVPLKNCTMTLSNV